MAFNFNWTDFPNEFYDKAQTLLTNALNKGPRPSVVADKIEIQELNFGTMAPELEILEIGELSEDKFRGMLKLTYNGDAFIELTTKVQVNPVIINSEVSLQARRGILAAHQPLIMPMLLKISQLQLRGIISLSLSKTNGITLSFKNDPLIGVEVSSSFDEWDVIKSFLQSQIETKLRNVLIEDLPQLFYSLSDKIIKNNPAPSRSSTSMPSSPRTPLFSPYNISKVKSLDQTSTNIDSGSLNDAHSINLEHKVTSDCFTGASHFQNQPFSKCGYNNNISKFSVHSPPLPQKNTHPRRNFSLDHLPCMTTLFPGANTASNYNNYHFGLNEYTRENSIKSPPFSCNISIASTSEAKIFDRTGAVTLDQLKSPPSYGLKDLLEPNIVVPPTSPNLKYCQYS